jgi:hypothetical protein
VFVGGQRELFSHPAVFYPKAPGFATQLSTKGWQFAARGSQLRAKRPKNRPTDDGASAVPLHEAAGDEYDE